jgi:hypothetical protein
MRHAHARDIKIKNIKINFIIKYQCIILNVEPLHDSKFTIRSSNKDYYMKLF